MVMNKYLSIITLNVNVLNAPIKRHRVAEWIRKCDPHICCLQETYFRKNRLTESESEELEKKFQVNGQKTNKQTKHEVAILISYKIDFKTKAIKRDLEGHFIILKGRIHQEDTNIINIYAPNIGASKYIRKFLEDFKKDINRNTLILGNFNTPLSTPMNRSSKQNINNIGGIEQCPRSKTQLTYIEPFIPKKQNTQSFQMHMEYFQR